MKKQASVSISDMKKNCGAVAQVLRALSHPQRLLLLCHLSNGKKTVGELERLCGGSQSSISQYLKLLKLEKMVSSEKKGLFVYYDIHDAKIKKLIVELHKLFCS